MKDHDACFVNVGLVAFAADYCMIMLPYQGFSDLILKCLHKKLSAGILDSPKVFEAHVASCQLQLAERSHYGLVIQLRIPDDNYSRMRN